MAWFGSPTHPIAVLGGEQAQRSFSGRCCPPALTRARGPASQPFQVVRVGFLQHAQGKFTIRVVEIDGFPHLQAALVMAADICRNRAKARHATGGADSRAGGSASSRSSLWIRRMRATVIRRRPVAGSGSRVAGMREGGSSKGLRASGLLRRKLLYSVDDFDSGAFVDDAEVLAEAYTAPLPMSGQSAGCVRQRSPRRAAGRLLRPAGGDA